MRRDQARTYPQARTLPTLFPVRTPTRRDGDGWFDMMAQQTWWMSCVAWWWLQRAVCFAPVNSRRQFIFMSPWRLSPTPTLHIGNQPVRRRRYRVTLTTLAYCAVASERGSKTRSWKASTRLTAAVVVDVLHQGSTKSQLQIRQYFTLPDPPWNPYGDASSLLFEPRT